MPEITKVQPFLTEHHADLEVTSVEGYPGSMGEKGSGAMHTNMLLLE